MRTLVTLAGAASLVAFSAAGAFAAGFEDVVIQPAPVAPAPVVIAPVVDDWTGFYVGGSIGTGQARLSGPDGDGGTFTTPDENFNSFGIHAGYMYDFGSFVVGGEAEWARLNFDNDNTVADNNPTVARLKLRAGYDAGAFLPYATIGAARISFDDIGGGTFEEDGAVYGLGLDYKVGQNFLIGAEYLRHQFNDVQDFTDVDLKADTLSLRASFRF